MTFSEWWREHEAELFSDYYDGDHWTAIYQLLQKAYEAGRESASA